MTKNEQIASILLEAAELLKTDNKEPLNEAILEKQKSSDKNVRKEVNAGLSGKYDEKFIRSEKDLADFLEKHGDDITKIALATKEDINNSRKFTKGKIATMAILLIGAITSAVTGGIAGNLQMKKIDAEFAARSKKMHDDFIKTTNEIHENFNKRSQHMKDAFDAQLKINKNSDIFNSMKESVEYESLNESALVAVSIVSGLATTLFGIVDTFLRFKDARNLEENIKYLKMIKRKLTQDITKIDDPKVKDKYETLIERINRAEDEYTRKVNVSQ